MDGKCWGSWAPPSFSMGPLTISVAGGRSLPFYSGIVIVLGTVNNFPLMLMKLTKFSGSHIQTRHECTMGNSWEVAIQQESNGDEARQWGWKWLEFINICMKLPKTLQKSEISNWKKIFIYFEHKCVCAYVHILGNVCTQTCMCTGVEDL